MPWRPWAFGLLTVGICLGAVADDATAQRMENGVAVFAALDKVTAKIKRLDVPIDETIEFGALKVTPRVCYSRPPTERPKTTTFVEIQETQLDGSQTKLFSGWMFAESPGLNAVEHPVFDIWLTGCEKPKNPLPVANTAGALETETQPGADQLGEQPPAAAPARTPPRKRPRRRRFRR